MPRSKTSLRREQKIRVCSQKRFWTCRSLFGWNDVFFYLIIGGRDTGKSYSVLDRFLRDFKEKGIPFYWLRLTQKVADSMLQNKAAKFVDADLVRKYNLELSVKGCEVFDHGVKMAEIMPLSTFYNQKGTASFDCDWKKGYNICLDECQREVGEKNTFDISYALVNTLENYVRDSKEKLRIVFICNYTETVSDILNLFNFIPETWGTYHLAKKKAVIAFLPPSEQYKLRRTGSVSDILMPEASTFSNAKVFDKSLLYGGKLIKPQVIIDFGNELERFTAWDDLCIKMYNNEKLPESCYYSMVPYIDGHTYDSKKVKMITNIYDKRGFKFRDLITQQRFTAALSKIRKK